MGHPNAVKAFNRLFLAFVVFWAFLLLGNSTK